MPSGPISEMKITVEITAFLKFIITCNHSQDPPSFYAGHKESEHLRDNITFSILVLRMVVLLNKFVLFWYCIV